MESGKQRLHSSFCIEVADTDKSSKVAKKLDASLDYCVLVSIGGRLAHWRHSLGVEDS